MNKKPKYNVSPEEMEWELNRMCETFGCTNYAFRGYVCCNECMGRGDDKPLPAVQREKLRRENRGKYAMRKEEA